MGILRDDPRMYRFSMADSTTSGELDKALRFVRERGTSFDRAIKYARRGEQPVDDDDRYEDQDDQTDQDDRGHHDLRLMRDDGQDDDRLGNGRDDDDDQDQDRRGGTDKRRGYDDGDDDIDDVLRRVAKNPCSSCGVSPAQGVWTKKPSEDERGMLDDKPEIKDDRGLKNGVFVVPLCPRCKRTQQGQEDAEVQMHRRHAKSPQNLVRWNHNRRR